MTAGVNPSNVEVRDAQPRDLPAVMAFIRKKAAFDGALESIEVTEEVLHKHLFGDRPSAYVVLAEIDGRAVGFASYFLTFSSFLGRPGIWLDDLFVDEDARGHGVGTTLLRHLAAIAHDRGYGRIEWHAAADNSKALGFYEGKGARLHEDQRLLRLDSSAVSRLARDK